MHKRNSFDAFTAGVKQTWEDAYRFAQGEEIALATTGQKIKRRTPYDFVAITDHSEYYGVLKDLMKDPKSGNLDRIQIIKGWSNVRTGFPAEKIYDIAWSGRRKHDPKTGKLPPVGNTVDIKTATYTHDIGNTMLSAVWTDPDFDPIRVLRPCAGDSDPALEYL